MHSYIVNASLQILPIVQDKHPYEWVGEAIAIIQQSTVNSEHRTSVFFSNRKKTLQFFTINTIRIIILGYINFPYGF